MATVAESLFGVTPESLMAARENQLQQRASQFAQLSPMQAAQAGFYTAGSRLGTGIGGLLGAPDPEMMRVTQRQSLLQGLNPSDPDSLRSAAQRAMESNDFQAAQELANRAMSIETAQAKLTSEQALANQRNRERAAADPLQQLIRTGKYTSASIEKYNESGKISDLEPIDKGDPTALSETKEGIFLINKQTGEKISRIGASPERGTKLTVSPEIKMAPDIVGAVSAVDKATEPEVNMMNSARLAKQLINQTANSNNSQTWEAARTTIAKAVGENKLSNEDIRRTGVDPRLVQGALDWVNKKISGVPNQDIQQQLFMLGSVLENSASARYDAKVSRYRGAASAAGFPGQPSTYFPTAAERNQVAPQSGVRDWNSLNK
jgi:hypothetical protein